MAPNFNPEVGFLRRTAFTRSYGQARYSPRPGLARRPEDLFPRQRRLHHRHPSYRPESKEVQGKYQMDLENSDVWASDVSRNYERLTTRFEVGNGVFIPPGEYEIDQVARARTRSGSAATDVRVQSPRATAGSTAGR